MYQYHGWAVLRTTFTSDEVEDSEDERVRQSVAEYLASRNWPYVLGMQAVNGAYHVWITGMPNHRPLLAWSPVEVFRRIAELAPGSYGLLFVWDDEDADGYNNASRVYVMARGELQERLDPFLAPCIPVLEYPWTILQGGPA
jgi:hypothetical protein